MSMRRASKSPDGRSAGATASRTLLVCAALASAVACARGGAPHSSASREAGPRAATAVVHPGTIEYYDGDRLVSTQSAATAPEHAAWYVLPTGRVPVVRVVHRGAPGAGEVLRYGPNGQLLDATHLIGRAMPSDGAP
jgi:hypothetical protein